MANKANTTKERFLFAHAIDIETKDITDQFKSFYNTLDSQNNGGEIFKTHGRIIKSTNKRLEALWELGEKGGCHLFSLDSGLQIQATAKSFADFRTASHPLVTKKVASLTSETSASISPMPAGRSTSPAPSAPPASPAETRSNVRSSNSGRRRPN